jgi:hypothetical protein
MERTEIDVVADDVTLGDVLDQLSVLCVHADHAS